MKPIIAITCAYDDGTNRAMLHMKYVEKVFENGGIPIMVHYNSPSFIMPKVDGLILSGGGDIDPLLFNQKPKALLTNCQRDRDLFEFSVLKQCENVPVLGICRGMQIINVAYGGSIIQDIEGHDLKIHQRHEVNIISGTKLFNIVKRESYNVNSLHHQVVDNIPKDFIVSAIDYKGNIEAMEHREKKIIAVQWHPEKMEEDQSIFGSFVKMCEHR